MAERDNAALAGFRTELYGCFTAWGDSLFELCDAVLLSPAPVHSIPSLSLEPVFRRSHGCLYKALANGVVDTDRLRQALLMTLPIDEPRVFAVDASTWDRCDAETSPERGFYYSASKHSNGQPIVAGWSYQWITQVEFSPTSWTAPCDVARIPPTENTTWATINQIRDLAARLPPGETAPMFVLDAGYDPIAISHELADTNIDIVCRIRNDRVFCADPPPRPNRPPETGGRPPRHGPKMKCADPDTWPTPSATATLDDARYGTIDICAWNDMHPRLGHRGHWTDHDTIPIVKGTVIRIQVEHLPKPSSRNTNTLWLWQSGPGDPDLELSALAYLRRFDIEHTFRFVKTTLGWTAPSISTPEQADRWTWLIIAVYTQLRLGRGVVADHRLPWEQPTAPQKLSPARVRRGFRRLGPTLGSPARPPKPARAGPGRPKGTPKPPRTRHPAIKKAA